MNANVQKFFELFDTLSDRDKHEVAVELFRRSTADGGLSDEELSLVVEESFAGLEKEEAKNARSNRTAG